MSNNWLGLKLFANVAWDVKLCGVVELLPTRSRHNAFKNTTCRPKRISGETSHLSVQTNHQFIIMKPYYLFLSCILTALLPFTCTKPSALKTWHSMFRESPIRATVANNRPTPHWPKPRKSHLNVQKVIREAGPDKKYEGNFIMRR